MAETNTNNRTTTVICKFCLQTPPDQDVYTFPDNCSAETAIWTFCGNYGVLLSASGGTELVHGILAPQPSKKTVPSECSIGMEIRKKVERKHLEKEACEQHGKDAWCEVREAFRDLKMDEQRQGSFQGDRLLKAMGLDA